MSSRPMIEASNISKTFYPSAVGSNTLRNLFLNGPSIQRNAPIKALNNISFKVNEGEFIGIIGRNGSGKSTLLHILSGAIPPDKGGSVYSRGKSIRLSLGMGFNQELSALENIEVNASLLGLTFKEIDAVREEIIAFAEVERFAETKLKYFSKGMRTRLAFSIALYTKTDIILMDEVFGGVGDAAFRKKANKAFKELILHNRTSVLVSHNANILRKFAHRVLLIEKGQLIFEGDPDNTLKEYRKLTNSLS